MTDDPDLPANLADALDGTEVDAAKLAAVARLLADLPVLEAPPAGVFDAIASEAFASPGPLERSTLHALPDAIADPPGSPGLRWTRWAAAAVVVVVVGVVGAVVIGSGDDPVEQRVELVALPGFADANGTALLIERAGEREVEIDLEGIDLPAGSHLELWLLDPDVSQTTSLGVLTDAQTYSLPADVDLTTMPILDVSLEPDDGDAAHSGVSVVRGEIDPS